MFFLKKNLLTHFICIAAVFTYIGLSQVQPLGVLGGRWPANMHKLIKYSPYFTFLLYAPSRQIHGYMYNTFMSITPVTRFWLWRRDFLWDGGQGVNQLLLYICRKNIYVLLLTFVQLDLTLINESSLSSVLFSLVRTLVARHNTLSLSLSHFSKLCDISSTSNSRNWLF